MAILEQEIELAPLSGEPAIVASARETRCRIMGELSADWEADVRLSIGRYEA